VGKIGGRGKEGTIKNDPTAGILGRGSSFPFVGMEESKLKIKEILTKRQGGCKRVIDKCDACYNLYKRLGL